MIDQELLQRKLVDAVRARGYRLEEVVSREPDGSVRVTVPDPTHVLVALRRFELLPFLRGLGAWLQRVDRAPLEAWYKAFTRALFLVGDPRRFAPHCALVAYADDDIAWTRPGHGREYEGMRRLLKPLKTRHLPELSSAVSWIVDGAAPTGRALRLAIATRELLLEQYLVHLHHAVSESFIEGRLRPGDAVRIEHVLAIDSVPPRYEYMRVGHRVDDAPERLWVAALLTEAP